jgi:hypothetical protein
MHSPAAVVLICVNVPLAQHIEANLAEHPRQLSE